MELDFKTVKALSSPTRIDILREACKNEATPTRISENIGRSKSTVASHLEKLQEAGLLEEDSEEGRRRVVYHPTSKTEAIMDGRSRKVKFSILSTASTAWIGAALVFGTLKNKAESISYQSGSEGGMGTMALDTGKEAARNATEKAAESGLSANPELVPLVAGIGFLSIAVAGTFYGLVASRLG